MPVCVFSLSHSSQHSRTQNRLVLPYRQSSLLSHLLIFRSLTMLSFGCGNQGDAFALCEYVCLRALRDRLDCISKEKYQKSSHTHPAQHKASSKWLNWELNNQNSVNADFLQSRSPYRSLSSLTETNYSIIFTFSKDRPATHFQPWPVAVNKHWIGREQRCNATSSKTGISQCLLIADDWLNKQNLKPLYEPGSGICCGGRVFQEWKCFSNSQTGFRVRVRKTFGTDEHLEKCRSSKATGQVMIQNRY